MAMASYTYSHNGSSEEWEDESPEIMTAEVDPSMTLASVGASAELPYDMAEWSAEEVTAYNALRSKRKKCCVGGCTPRSLPIARSYHQLPVRNEEIWGKWIGIIRWSRNDPDWIPNGDAAPLVCSRHFPDTDFISYEASSRVRLSHTAVPLYFVDPPEGTELDPRFASPLPVPPISATGKAKVLSKYKNGTINEVCQEGKPYIKESLRIVSPHEENNAGYDIEEVNDEAYEYNDNEDGEDTAQDYYDTTHILLCKPEIKSGINKSLPKMSRLSAPPALASFQNQRNFKVAAAVSKPPGLIRANFTNKTPSHQLKSAQQIAQIGASTKNMKTILRNGIPSVASRNSPPTKHKIGLAKCRLIVQTLENQFRIAKMRLAEQLGIPYQVVHGVWNMKDSLKDKL